MTAGQLRAILVGVPDGMEVVLRIADEEGLTYLSGLDAVAQETGCADTLALMLDGWGDPELAEDHADGAP